jgi:WD domain, G-beta repeat
MVETPIITTQISQKDLRFQPGGQPVSFEVKAINASEQFATFQIKVLAAGVEATAGDYWYRLSPEVSAKTPPGDSTSFLITILDTPKPGFVGTMNLFVQIYCLELRQEEREILRLKLEPSNTEIPLKIDLGTRSFKVQSSESVEIPVTVANLAQFPVEALLRCNGLNPSWLPEGNERRVQLRAGGQAQTQFLCRIPPPAHSPSESYPFTVEALQGRGTVSKAEGVVLVMPTGLIEWSVTPSDRQIPEKRGWWPQWKANTASYLLQWTNEGNLPQQVTAQAIAEPDQPKCGLQIEPPHIDLEMGANAQLVLAIHKNRHWFGPAKKCAYEVKAVVLSAPALPVQEPTRRLKLRIQPMLPLWMQGLGVLALLWLLWWLSWLNSNSPFWGHRDAVNSVRFNGIGDDLVSGSSDKSIVAWHTNGFFNPFLNQQAGKIGKTGDRAVRVVRYRPVNNDQVAAGLENGEIQLWSARPGNKTPIQTFFAQKDDRVLDLAFSQDSRTLFSGHGSGTVVQWDLDPQDMPQTSSPTMIRKTQAGFSVYAIALVGHQETDLAIAGIRNRLALLNLKTNQLRNVSIDRGSQADYILSIATADRKRTLLATANNRGRIELWNLQPCLSGTANCELLDRWTADPQGIHAVALSADGCYLASGGEGGKTMVWPLNPRGDRSARAAQGQELNQSSRSINTVDIFRGQDEILVARGGDDRHVSLYRIPATSSTCP